MLDELVKFAKANHKGYAIVPDEFLRAMFVTYKDYTLVNRVDGEIQGFAIYQEWPNCLNFICIVGNPENDHLKNVIAMMDGKRLLPDKKIVFFDETKMRLRVLCQQQQQVGLH